MMNNANDFRNKRVTIRFKEAEYNKLFAAYNKTTSKVFADYLRSILLNKTVTIKVRNTSLDDIMPVLIVLKDEVNAIGNNFNQLVKRLHTLQDINEIKGWLILNESTKKILLAKTEEIKSKISEIDDRWCQ